MSLAQKLIDVNNSIRELEMDKRRIDIRLSMLYARRAQVVRQILDRLQELEQPAVVDSPSLGSPSEEQPERTTQ